MSERDIRALNYQRASIFALHPKQMDVEYGVGKEID
jgi:hypothetical protein